MRTYRALITVTEKVTTDARAVVTRTARVRGLDLMVAATVDAIRHEITRHCDLATRVVSQTTRRVLHGEQAPPDQKVYSIFETHTDLIKRGKVLKDAEPRARGSREEPRLQARQTIPRRHRRPYLCALFGDAA